MSTSFFADVAQRSTGCFPSARNRRRPCGANSSPAEILEDRTLLTALFAETFDTGVFDPARWSSVQNATIDDVGIGEPSGSFSARINGNTGTGDVLESAVIDLSGQTAATLTYHFQRGGGGNPTETNDFGLVLEYRNLAGQWATLDHKPGQGPTLREFGQSTLALPGDALHSQFQFRFRQVGRSTAVDLDDWFVDNVEIHGNSDPAGQPFSASQTQTGTLFTPNVLTFEFHDVLVPTRAGELKISAVGDLSFYNEHLELRIDGHLIDNVFVLGGVDGPTSQITLTLSQALLEEAAADGVITFTIKPSAGVIEIPNTSLTLELSYQGRPADATPPQLQSVELQRDGRTLIAQFNNDDLHAAAANPENYRLVAAHGDANGDGDPFNDGDETAVAIDSVSYHAETDQVTLHARDELFGNQFRLLIDGDAITDLAGNALEGGDREFTFDRTAAALARELVAMIGEVEARPGVQQRLELRGEVIVHLIDRTNAKPKAIEKHLENLERKLDRLVERGRISEADRDRLVQQIDLVERALPEPEPRGRDHHDKPGKNKPSSRGK